MTQAFFFLTMLTAAALILYLLWYLRDSHEQEERLIAGRLAAIERKRKAESSYQHLFKAGGAGIPAYASSSRTSIAAGTSGCSAGTVRPVSIQKISAAFFDVGTPEDDSVRSNLSCDRNQCA